MNILFIAPRFHTNQFLTLKILIKKYNVFLHCITKGKIENYSDITPTIIPTFKISLLNSLIPNFFFYYNFFKQKKIDIIIIRFYRRYFLYFFLILGKIFKCKIIIYNQSASFYEKKNKLINRIKNLEKKIIYYIFTKRWYSTILPRDNDKIINIPFIMETKKNFLPISKKFNILCVAKFQKRKDLFLLLNCVKNLIKKKHNVHLTIIGQTNGLESQLILNKINFFIKSNNLLKYVDILKNIKHSYMKYYYKNCNLYVLPSYDEPAAISILEAQANSRPAICSDTCGTSMYLDKNCGRIFRSKSLNSLEKNILFFLQRKNSFNKFYFKSLENCNKKFSVDKFNQKLNYILNRD